MDVEGSVDVKGPNIVQTMRIMLTSLFDDAHRTDSEIGNINVI